MSSPDAPARPDDSPRPGEAAPGPLDRPALPSRLSPSRMSDFVKCPRSFYYKSILRMPSLPTEATTRGTITHTALEGLFSHPRDERTVEAALAKLEPAWAELVEHDVRYRVVVAPEGAAVPVHAETGEPDYGSLDIDEAKVADLIASAREMVRNYFAMERPTSFDPAGLELRLTVDVDGVTVHGIIDRLDEVPTADGARVYVSDYKTGALPRARYLDEAFFAMKVYAVMVEAAMTKRVHSLRLIYLRAGDRSGIYTLPVNDALIDTTRRRIKSIAQRIERAHRLDEWPTRTSPLCNWCDFQPICPAFNPGADGIGVAEGDGTVLGADAGALPARTRRPAARR